MTTILCIRLNQRDKNAEEFQKIISKYGCNIKTRIGLHDIQNGFCASEGIILLELINENKIFNSLIEELNKLENIKIKSLKI